MFAQFSTGNRGAALCEQLLDAGYAVIFVHRSNSAFPFARKLLAPACSAEKLLRDIHSGSAAPRMVEAAAAHAACDSRLLALPFTTVDDYLKLLREASCALAPAGKRALLVLAAAVSDFYVPAAELPEHKIQSGGSSSTADGHGAAADGSGRAKEEEKESGKTSGLTLHLRPVPKVLGAIKQGSGGGGDDSVRGDQQAAWAPQAFVVSFKLETNRAILLAKAAGALAKYGVDVVCANLLQSYKREVTLVVADANEGHAAELRGRKRPRVSAATVQGDEIDEIKVEGVCCTTLALEETGAQAGADIEPMLVAELVRRHDLHQ